MQGVGFRPFVHRLAHEHALAGWVRNDRRGVLLEVEGEPGALERFLARLAERAAAAGGGRAGAHRAAGRDRRAGLSDPRTARGRPARPRPRLTLGTSCRPTPPPAAHASPSCSIRRDRRHRYPFINCTHCGPRFTIVRGIPYDRALTTMAAFSMCARLPARVRGSGRPPLPRAAERLPCLRARGCACSTRAGRPAAAGGDPIAAAAAALARRARSSRSRGSAASSSPARADDERAVAELRRAQAARGEAVRADGRRSRTLRASSSSCLRPSTAAGRPRAPDRDRPPPARRARGRRGRARLARLGVMLPSTPLHHLLLGRRGHGARDDAAATAARSRSPPTTRTRCARLGAIADLLLVHDRPIEVRADDSVVRALGCTRRAGARALMLRRGGARLRAAASLQPRAALDGAAAAGVRRRAEEHLLRRQGLAGLGRAAHRRPAQLRDVRSFRDGHRPLRSAVRRRARGGRARPAPRLPLHRLRAGARGRAIARGAASPRPPRGGARRARASGARRSARSTTGRGSAATAPSGAASCWRATSRTRGASGTCTRCALPGGDAAAREPWRMACAWLLAAPTQGAPRCRRHSPARVAERALGAGRASSPALASHRR